MNTSTDPDTPAVPAAPASQRLAERVAGFLGAHTSRRGFIARTAVIGRRWRSTRVASCCGRHGVRRGLRAGSRLRRRLHRLLLYDERCQPVPTRHVRGWLVEGRRIKPVSYTHLTLP